MIILKQIVLKTQEWNWYFDMPSDSWEVDQNIITY